MKLHNYNHTITYEGTIEDGGNWGDSWGDKRRAEKYAVVIYPDDVTSEHYSVEIRAKGRKVTKAGAISKRDTYQYVIFNRDLETAIGAALVAEGHLDPMYYRLWLQEHELISPTGPPN